MNTLNPYNQSDWADIIDRSVLKPSSVAKNIGINPSQLYRYTRKKQPSTPNTRNTERIVKFMAHLTDMPRQERHPSYGYATAEEIAQLNRMGMGPERDRILRTIEKRTKFKGKNPN